MPKVQYDFTDDPVDTLADSLGSTAITGFTLWNYASAFHKNVRIIADGALENGQAAQFESGNGGGIYTCIEETTGIGDVPPNTTTEVLVQFRMPAAFNGTGDFQIMLRDEGGGPLVADWHSLTSVGTGLNDWRICRTNSEAPWTFAPQTITNKGFVEGDIVWARVRVETTGTWYAKMWIGEFAAEPGPWDIDGATWGESGFSLEGYVGIGVRYATTLPCQWGWFSCSTDGDSAPGPALPEVPPVITADPTDNITETTATGNVTTNEIEGTMWGGVWPQGSPPADADAIKAGTGAIAGTASSQAVSAASLIFPVTGLTRLTDYGFWFVQDDDGGLTSNIDNDDFSTIAIAPILSNPTVSDILVDGATGSVTTNSVEGTMWAGVYPDVATPTPAEIKAGTGAVWSSGPTAVTQATESFVSTGLASSTTYRFHFVQDDADGDESLPVNAQFTTGSPAQPVLTNPTAAPPTADPATRAIVPEVSTDISGGTVYYTIYAGGSPSPSAGDIKSGTGTGAIAGQNDSQPVLVDGVQTFAETTGLTPATSYDIWFVHENLILTDSAPVSVNFSTDAVSISNPQATSPTSTTVIPQVVVDNDGSGTLYYVITDQNDNPSAAQIKAGQNSAGGAAYSANNQVVTSLGIKTFATATGLTEGTDYEIYFIQENVSPADSNIASVQFSTTEIVKTTTVRLADISGVDRANLSNLIWGWYDVLPATGVFPTDFDINGSTDGSGFITVTISKSTLNDGQTGYLGVYDAANGWANIYPATVNVL